MLFEKIYKLFKEEITINDFELKFGELEGICQDFHTQDLTLEDTKNSKESYHYNDGVEITNTGYTKENHAYIKTEILTPKNQEHPLITKRLDRFYKGHHAS